MNALFFLCVLLLGFVPDGVAAEQMPGTTAGPGPAVSHVLDLRIVTWPRDLNLSGTTVTVRSNGRTVSAPLSRAAYLERKSSRPGLWAAEIEGAAGRLSEVALVVERDGENVVLWKRLVRFEDVDRNLLTLRADIDKNAIRVTRTFWTAYEGSPDRRIGRVSLLVAFGWGLIVVVYIGLVVRRASVPARVVKTEAGPG